MIVLPTVIALLLAANAIMFMFVFVCWRSNTTADKFAKMFLIMLILMNGGFAFTKFVLPYVDVPPITTEK